MTGYLCLWIFGFELLACHQLCDLPLCVFVSLASKFTSGDSGACVETFWDWLIFLVLIFAVAYNQNHEKGESHQAENLLIAIVLFCVFILLFLLFMISL